MKVLVNAEIFAGAAALGVSDFFCTGAESPPCKDVDIRMRCRNACMGEAAWVWSQCRLQNMDGINVIKE